MSDIDLELAANFLTVTLSLGCPLW